MFKIYIYHQHFYTYPRSTYKKPKKTKEEKQDDNIHRSVRRTRVAIHDILTSNHFDYWCTWTFDKRKVNRYHIEGLKIKMSMWLRNQRSSHSPNLQYIIVPEKHKDGAYHFHGLLANYNGQLYDSKRKTKHGQTIYNINSYRSGFSTAVKIDDNYDAISTYMQKYITKDMPLFAGKKRYFCSQGLSRPIVHQNALQKLGLQPRIWQKTPHYVNDMFEVFTVNKSELDTVDENTIQNFKHTPLSKLMRLPKT